VGFAGGSSKNKGILPVAISPSPAIHVTISQFEEFPRQRERLADRLREVRVVTAKAMPEPKESHVWRKGARRNSSTWVVLVSELQDARKDHRAPPLHR
jgi:hypothetical protein